MRWLACVVALACACADKPTNRTNPTKIDNGVRIMYSLASGTPDQAARVIRRRLELARVTHTVATLVDKVVVELAPLDRDALQSVRGLISRTAKLELKTIVAEAPVMRDLHARVATDPEAAGAGITAEIEREGTPVTVTRYLQAPDRAALQRYLDGLAQRDATLRIPADLEIAYARVVDDTGATRWRTHVVEATAGLTGAAIKRAVPAVDPITKRSTVSIELDDAGTATFAALTKRLVGQQVAILLDGRVMSAPRIMEPITAGRLSLVVDPDDPRALAIELTSGPLPGAMREDSIVLLKNGRMITAPE